MRARRTHLRTAYCSLAMALLALPGAAQAPSPDDRMAEVRRILRFVSSVSARIEDVQQRALLTANLAARMVEAGDTEGALAAANSLADARGKSNALSMIARIQAEEGQFEAAMQTARLIPLEEVREAILGSFSGVHLRQGNVAAAVQSLSALPEESPRRIQALLGVASWYAKNKQPDQSARFYLMAKDAAGARVESARDRREFIESASLLSHVASAQIRGGHRTAGLETIEGLRSLTDRAPDEGSRGFIHNSIASAFAGAGEIQLALEALRIVPEQERDNILYRLAIDRSNAADFSIALQLALELQNLSSRDSVYQAVATRQVAVGDSAGSQATLQLITNPGVRAKALQTIGQWQTRRKPEEAGLTLNQAESETRYVTEDKARAELMRDLSGSRAQRQEFDRALELALENPLPAERARALEGVLGNMALRGELERARRIAEEQTIPIVQAYAWFGIGQGLGAQVRRDLREAEKKKSPTP